jgi:hypothetical protein
MLSTNNSSDGENMQPFATEVQETICKGSGEMAKDLPIGENGTAICPVCHAPQHAEYVGEQTLIAEHPAAQPAMPAGSQSFNPQIETTVSVPPRQVRTHGAAGEAYRTDNERAPD